MRSFDLNNLRSCEIKLLAKALDSLKFADLTRAEQTSAMRLSERLEECISELRESELYTEDKDGFTELTELGREALEEKYGRKD